MRCWFLIFDFTASNGIAIETIPFIYFFFFFAARAQQKGAESFALEVANPARRTTRAAVLRPR